MSIPVGFVQSLVDYAEQLGSSTSLEQERDKLWAKIQNGDDLKTLITASPAGKNFTFQVSMTLEEKFHAYVEAIKLYQNLDASPLTFIDFSRAYPGGGINPVDPGWPFP
jgi:hypothetical protein